MRLFRQSMAFLLTCFLAFPTFSLAQRHGGSGGHGGGHMGGGGGGFHGGGHSGGGGFRSGGSPGGFNHGGGGMPSGGMRMAPSSGGMQFGGHGRGQIHSGGNAPRMNPGTMRPSTGMNSTPRFQGATRPSVQNNPINRGQYSTRQSIPSRSINTPRLNGGARNPVNSSSNNVPNFGQQRRPAIGSGNNQAAWSQRMQTYRNVQQGANGSPVQATSNRNPNTLGDRSRGNGFSLRQQTNRGNLSGATTTTSNRGGMFGVGNANNARNSISPAMRQSLLNSRVSYYNGGGGGGGNPASWHGNNPFHQHHSSWYRGNWGGGYGHNNGNFIGGVATGIAISRFGLGGYPISGWRYSPLGFWGCNRLNYGFGLGWGSYYNPYYLGGAYGASYTYAQPIVTTNYYSTDLESTDASTSTDPSAQPGISDFDQARASFRRGDYGTALTQVDRAIASAPRDAEMHEFRALTLFALRQYKESAETLYGVLAVGPGWDWPTMSGLYSDVNVYTAQLRALEAARKKSPNDPTVSFLLGYHYLTCGFPDAALRMFVRVTELQPKDQVAAQMVKFLTDAHAPAPNPEAEGTPVAQPPKKEIPADQRLQREDVQGDWVAQGKDGMTYRLSLTKDNSFKWSFGKEGSTQTIQGIFALDNNTLALEPNTDDGTLIASLTKTPDGFTFNLANGPEEDNNLKFTREKK